MPSPANFPYRAWLLGVFLIILTLGSIYPKHPLDMCLEHIPTLAALFWLTLFGIRRPLSNLSYTLIFVFLCLHVLGAHYTYSEVPYEDWTRSLFGRGLNETLGFKRNHYDRLVHFLFGLLMAPAAIDLGVRFAKIKPGFWAAVFGVGLVSICGNVYETIEWTISMVASDSAAANYNGEQGDTYDAAKDVTLNFSGAVISALVVLVAGRRAQRTS